MTSERKGLAIRSAIPAGYAEWLVGLKARISAARQQAALAVNRELVRLYHRIGVEILARQSHQSWGAKVIDRLVAEYALSGIDKPIGIAEYRLVRALPKPLDTNLPSIAEIEAELAGETPPPKARRKAKP